MTDLGHDTTPGTRHPDWMVQSVFDPDGEGHDFAYTIGLFESGLPELHLWARPSLGEDPGEDWVSALLTGACCSTSWRGG